MRSNRCMRPAAADNPTGIYGDKHIPGEAYMKIRVVLAAGEQCTRQIVDFYLGPNLTAAQIRAALEREFDPIKVFSAAARDELLDIS